jgi:hypothetical protein
MVGTSISKAGRDMSGEKTILGDGALTALGSGSRPLPALLKRLNEYKELIAIIAFVVGGVLWVFGYFVTKSQFAELKCFSKNSTIHNRELIKIRDAESVILDRSSKYDELIEKRRSTPLAEQEKRDMKRIELELEKTKSARKIAEERFNKAQARLEDNDCLGGDEK